MPRIKRSSSRAVSGHQIFEVSLEDLAEFVTLKHQEDRDNFLESVATPLVEWTVEEIDDEDSVEYEHLATSSAASSPEYSDDANVGEVMESKPVPKFNTGAYIANLRRAGYHVPEPMVPDPSDPEVMVPELPKRVCFQFAIDVVPTNKGTVKDIYNRFDDWLDDMLVDESSLTDEDLQDRLFKIESLTVLDEPYEA